MLGNGPVKSGAAAPIASWKWGVVWLMFLATMINYMDRQTMGATSSRIMSEFELKETGYGWIEFSFQISFAVSQLLAGYVADRLNLRWLYAAALVIWSAAGFFTGLAGTMALLIACRVVLGFGEAFNWPCAVSIVGRILPREARSLANGIFHSGASIGAAVTPLLVLALLSPADDRGAQIIASIRSVMPEVIQPYIGGFDWRFIFQLVGGIGLLWAVLWLWVVRGQRAAEVNRVPEPAPESATAGTPSFWSIFTLQKFWIALTISTTVNVSWHFYRVWLPRILKRDLGYSDQEMLFVFAGFFVAADLGSMAAGWITSRITRAGVSVERARQIVMFGSSVLCLLAVPVALLPSVLTLPNSEDLSAAWVKVPLILILAAGAMGGFANMFALGQDVSPRHTGQVVGIMGAFPWFLLAATSPLVGMLYDSLGTFSPMLLVIGFVPMGGAVVGLWWPREGRK